jgi:dTDP-4-dehydrorhamnose reductase
MGSQGSIAVVGASGQVARALQRAGSWRGVKVVASGRPETDITDPVSLMAQLLRTRPRLVVNAAAYTAVDKAESEPELACRINAEGPCQLARICALNDIPLIHLSTDYVFDGAKSAPYVESDAPAPLGVYGASKLAGEDAIRTEHARHVILRTAWVYGPDGSNFVKTMLRLGAEREELRVVDEQVGAPTSARDVAEAILDIAERLEAFSPPHAWGTYHLTAAGSTTWHGFAAEIFRAAAAAGMRTPRLVAIPASAYPAPARRPTHSVLSNTKIAVAFGIRLPSWRKSLQRDLPAIVETVRRSSRVEAA